MKRVVIGTAGHVDHGKTSLIKALTGVDCDRLKEEKERGLTIELGFTSLTLPSDQRIGVVDVPGHIKFIRHMLSGASGIDLVLLVVAADEGVMPQTKEHIQICELLEVESGIVALTKTDLVDDDLLELAREDVKEFLSHTFLKDAPIIPVSSVGNTGLDDLLSALDTQIEQAKEKQINGIPLLPIDRVFSMKGFGTVVTGTLRRGTFHEGQEVEILPGGHKAKIRNLQVHSQQVDQVLAGMRTAVNLQGLGISEVARGEWIVPSATFRPTRVLDVRLTMLQKKPGKGGIKLYIGTAEVLGEISLHELDGIDVARIRLKTPVLATYGDKFILRGVSPQRTLGGGTVLNPSPMHRFSPDVIRDLLGDDFARRIHGMVSDAGIRGISKKDLTGRFAVEESVIEKAVGDLLSKGEIIRYDTANDLMVSQHYVMKLKELVVEALHDFHEKNPDSQGISKEHLRSFLKGNTDQKLFHKVLTELIKAKEIEETGPNLRKAGFNASLGVDQQELSDKIYRMLIASGFEPPRLQELAQKLQTDEKTLEKVLDFMCRQGQLIKIKQDIYVTDVTEKEIKERVRTFLKRGGIMTPVDLKTIVQVSRKYAIPYLEYLDRIRFTIRVGDVRKLSSHE